MTIRKTQNTSIGLDIGRSTTKAVALWQTDNGWERTELMFPSAVTLAGTLNDDTAALKARSDTVTVGNKVYWIGETALLQGDDKLSGSLKDDWMLTPEHGALVLGALAKLASMGVPNIEGAFLAVGLPARLYPSQHAALSEEMRKLCPKAHVKVLNQAMGPLYSELFTDQCEESDSTCSQGITGVIEVGQYTSDIALTHEGTPKENAINSSVGMSLVAQNVVKAIAEEFKVTNINLAEATRMLESKVLKNYGKTDITHLVLRAAEPVAKSIVDDATRLFGDYGRQMDNVIVAGGGAPLIAPAIRAIWPDAICPANARFSVADGFARVGGFYLANQNS